MFLEVFGVQAQTFGTAVGARLQFGLATALQVSIDVEVVQSFRAIVLAIWAPELEMTQHLGIKLVDFAWLFGEEVAAVIFVATTD